MHSLKMRTYMHARTLAVHSQSLIAVVALCLFATPSALAADFGAYYTKLDSGGVQ